MVSSTAFLLAAASTLLSTAAAHMTMVTPHPYGNPDSSPLKPDGSDFPCKQPAAGWDAPSSKDANSAAIGVEVPLTFKGSAVHGGGSCQVSLTTDKVPTKNSKWMVIHSIVGGCPTKNLAGNGPNDPFSTSTASTYSFKVPEGIAPGDYTLAWTWFNKIGNREMYMNCAPFTVTGGKKRGIEARKEQERMARRSSFPAMFVANIGNQCTTVDNKDVEFPDPGASHEKFGSGASVPATGSGCAQGGSGSSGSSGSGSGSGSGSAPSPSISAAPKPDNEPVPAATVAPSVAPAVPTPAAAPSVAPAAPAPVAAGSSSGSGSSSCGANGALVCSSDGSKFGICDATGAVMRPVASGTKCANGQIVSA